MERSSRSRLVRTGQPRAERPVGAVRRPVYQRFSDAARGFGEAYREEPNLRFHLFAAAMVLVLARAVALSGLPLLYLLGTIAFVLAAELINTAVERAVNLAAGEAYHPLARQAKDVAAGAVLIAAAHAAAAGWYLFVQPRGMTDLIAQVLQYGQHRPLEAMLLTLGAGFLGVAALVVGERQRSRR